MQSHTDHYHVRLLGPPQVERNERPIARLESQKAFGVLFYLCSHSKAITRSQLASLFWGDKPESRGRGNLSRVLHSIGRELPGCLEADRRHVRFRRDERVWLDIVHFERLVASGQFHSLAAAIELVRGEFLEDLSVRGCPEFDLWLGAQREKWRQRTAQLLQTVIGHHMERGEYEDGIRYVNRLLALEPWQEEAHRQKMLLLHLSGRRSAALAQFEQCRRLLAEELGVLPSNETLQLRRQIEEMSAGLTSTVRPPTRRQPLVERGEEHTRLVRQWEATRRGQGRFCLVEGSAGVGKTALIEDVLDYAAGLGARVLRSRCYEYRSGLVYQAIVDALRPLFESPSGLVDRLDVADTWLVELSRLWPAVHVQHRGIHPSLDEEPTARHRLFEAIAQFLDAAVTAEGSMALFIDDLHAADQVTLDLLRYLFHRLQHRPLWFVCACRREETTPNHPLTLWSNVLLREGLLARVPLAPLSTESVFQLIRHFEGLTAQQMRLLGHFLWKTCEGNPFVLEQMQNELSSRQVLSERAGQWRLDAEALAALDAEAPPVPQAVAALMENRLARLNPRARRLLQVAAAVGRAFELPLLLAVSGEPVEWVEICLTSWMGRGLVEEEAGDNGAGGHRYHFAHRMIWRVVLSNLSDGQRARLTERIQAARRGELASPPPLRRIRSGIVTEVAASVLRKE